MSHSVETLIAEIEAAFAGVGPGGMGIYEAEVRDGYGSEDEIAAARRRDTFVDWRDIPDSALEACTCALSHLTPQSWQFCLPAYMRYSLRHPGGHSTTVDHTIYALDVGDDASLRSHRRAKFAALNRVQVLAVRNFLQFARRQMIAPTTRLSHSTRSIDIGKTIDGHDTR